MYPAPNPPYWSVPVAARVPTHRHYKKSLHLAASGQRGDAGWSDDDDKLVSILLWCCDQQRRSRLSPGLVPSNTQLFGTVEICLWGLVTLLGTGQALGVSGVSGPCEGAVGLHDLGRDSVMNLTPEPLSTSTSETCRG